MRLCLALLLTFNASAASWYVDNAATGANNGTNWANAWVDITNVVWGASGVTAGDTLYISGGSTSKTYTNSFTVGASGTLTNRINIRVGQEVGHNGTVILSGAKYGTNCPEAAAITCYQSNVTFNGDVSGASHFVIRDWFNYTNKNIAKGIVGGDPGHQIKIFWLTISNINSCIHLASVTNQVIGFCNLTAWGDACIALVDSRMSPPDFWDSNLVFSNKFYCIYNEATGGPDGVQCQDGVSIFGNRFETVVDNSLTNRVSNHVDYLQSDGGKYMKLYNNEIVNIGDSAFSPAPFSPGRGLFNLKIYNNIFRITQQIDPFPQYIRMYNQQGMGGYTNVHIMNNLFVDRTNGTQAIYIGLETGSSPGTNNILANNIFVNVGMPTAAIWQLEKTTGAVQSAWIITNNIMYHATPANARVNYLDTNYTVAQWEVIDPSTGTNLPAFVSYTPYAEGNDFHLRPTDTNAIDLGFDYSATFTNDYELRTRAAPWDMGPFEWFDNAALIECQIGPRLIQAAAVATSNSICFYWPSNELRMITRIHKRTYTNQPTPQLPLTNLWPNWSLIYSVTSAPPSLAGSFCDTNVTNGVRYEYQITTLVTNWVCNSFTTNQWWDFQYISTGTEVPLTDTRGKLILLVESGIAASLVTELDRLEQDLIGDGYKIYRHDIASVNVLDAGWAAAVTNTKALIVTDYNMETNIDWTVFIVGNVPIPYSGLQSPGSHADNLGAHPADWYYADMSSATNWTDTTVSNTTALYLNNWNVPGDGKFDQDFPPTTPEMRIGRINLRNMPLFGKTEVELLRQYLDRNHAWRHKGFTVRDRALIIPEGRPLEAHNVNAGFFGNTHSTDLGLWLDVATNIASSYLFAASRGAGLFTRDLQLGWTTNFAQTRLYAAFTSMHGSYYGNWDSAYHTNVVLLAPLASEGYVLTTYYREQVNNFDFTSMGDPIGKELHTMAVNNLLTESDFFNIHIRFHQFGQIVSGGHFITAERPRNYTTLMGDPTLRVRVVAPPTNVVVTPSGSDNIVSWTAASDSNIQGYHIYRAPTADLNDFTRLTSTPVSSPYTNVDAAAGVTYWVRTVKLEQSDSRSYYNASQGMFAEAQAGESGAAQTGVLRGGTLRGGRLGR